MFNDGLTLKLFSYFFLSNSFKQTRKNKVVTCCVNHTRAFVTVALAQEKDERHSSEKPTLTNLLSKSVIRYYHLSALLISCDFHFCSSVRTRQSHRYVEERSAVRHGEAFKQEDLVETKNKLPVCLIVSCVFVNPLQLQLYCDAEKLKNAVW